MAYIYLEELKKILPGILGDWIDGDDESWEWIFQEIEQKCHAGKHRKGKKWKKHIKDDINTLKSEIAGVLSAQRNDINKLESLLKGNIDNVTQLGLAMKDFGAEIRRLRNEITAAKSMAETAKQRTEVDYSKYSGKSDGKISYCNPEAKKLNEELNSMTSDDIARWCREHESDCSRFNNKCASCKHKLEEPLDQPCVGCCYNGMNISGMDKWEAKENE